jgi:hypothetical protein
LVAAFALALALSAGPAKAAAPLTRGFTDDVWFDGVAAQWVPRAVATGAGIALVEIDWASVQPSPARRGFDPANPSGPQFNFGYVDFVVREFANTGVAPAFLVTDAPRWAEGAGGPPNLVAAGAWNPDPTAFGQLATAMARRYSGSYPDPLHAGRKLPRVKYFQAWAEANFDVHLSPQWTSTGQPASPGIYRNLLNAFYAGVKSVHHDNIVIASGTGPFGDPPGGSRMRPVEFVRDLLCLRGGRLTPVRCPNPAHFDALAQDPYEIGGPTTSAINPDDVSAPDLGRLTRALNKASRLGRALPRGHKRLWVTEFSYDSNPPNPSAVSTYTQARWLEQSFYIFWKQGADTVVWYLIRDSGGTNYAVDYFSGVYFRNGRRKPSFEAFRFPLVVMDKTVWGISPRRGKVFVQRQKRNGKWGTLFRINGSAGGTFTHKISKTLGGNFRAVINGESSLVWSR